MILIFLKRFHGIQKSQRNNAVNGVAMQDTYNLLKVQTACSDKYSYHGFLFSLLVEFWM